MESLFVILAVPFCIGYAIIHPIDTIHMLGFLPKIDVHSDIYGNNALVDRMNKKAERLDKLNRKKHKSEKDLQEINKLIQDLKEYK